MYQKHVMEFFGGELVDRYKKLLSDAGLFVISNFASRVMIFFLLPLYTRVLTTTEYGIVDLLTNTINLIYPIFTLSIAEATLRFALEKDVENSEVLSASLFFTLISTLILAFLSPFICDFIGISSEYIFFFLLLYLGFNLNNCFSYYARGCNKTKLFAMQGVIRTALVVVLNLLFLLILKLGIKGYLIATIVADYLTVFFIISKGEFWKDIIRFKLNKALIKEMLQYSIPMIPTIIAWWISNASDKYIITAKLGLAASGIYSVAYKIPSILTVITSIFTQAWQISAISNYGQDDNAEFFSTVYKYFNIVSVVACSLLILFSQLLGELLFAKEYFVAWRYVPLLLIAFLFSGLSGFLASIYTSARKTKLLFISTSVGATLNIILNILLVGRYGVMAAAYTTMISFLFVWIVRLKNSSRIIAIKINLIRDTITYVVLIIQAIIVSQITTYGYYGGFMGMLIILLINIKTIASLCSIFYSGVMKIVKKSV